MAMATSFRSGGTTGVVLSEVFGLLGLIIAIAGLFVSSPLSVALKCDRHNSSELLWFRHQNRSISKAYFPFSLECWFSWQLAHNLRTSEVISPFAFVTPLTGISIVPRVHYEEYHNACKVDVIVAHVM